jgi:hypothetical protein
MVIGEKKRLTVLGFLRKPSTVSLFFSPMTNESLTSVEIEGYT